MATTGDFPSNCFTNTCIFQDYGELAYIVCTVATPPSNNNAVQSPSPESNLARLRVTEYQFRQASILAVMDSDTSQLFTFYKKVDVLKDQKTLLAKFGQILRNNSCVIAYKAAARIPDMFKPEHTKLYRLFVAALLASVEIAPHDSRKVLRLGQRYLVIERHAKDERGSACQTDWSLVRTDLQVIQTGHVSLTVVLIPDLKLIPISAAGTNMPKVAPVVLVPGGQIALYRDSSNEPLKPKKLNGQRRAFWESKIQTWMKTEGDVDIGEDASWIELELPVSVQKVDGTSATTSPTTNTDSEPQAVLESILWPAHMCFVRKIEANPYNIDTRDDEDPLQFVMQWIESTTEREAELQQQVVDDAMNGDSALFNDDTSFDNMETFQPFGPPAFPTSQTVYPTPPDVVMTHTTPAMSSVDGLAMTPANTFRTTGDNSHVMQDVDMTGGESTHAPAVGSGFYDEDLFEEVPEGTFDQEGGGPEPNWDFFDKPGMDVDPPEGVYSAADRQSEKDTPLGERSELSEIRGPDLPPGTQTSEVPTKGISDSSPTLMTPTTKHRLGAPSSSADADTQLSLSVNSVPSRDTCAASPSRRRRSSIFDAIDSEKPERRHDAKYSRKGQFWFDANAKLHSDKTLSLATWSHRESSSPSISDSDSDSSQSMDDRHLESPNSVKSTAVRPWHEYRPAVTSPELKVSEFDTSSLETEIMAILDLLKIKSPGPSLERIFGLREPPSGSDERPVGHRMMLAHIFVDQYAQASLLHGGFAVEDEQCANETDVSVDLNQIDNGYAAVAQLMAITPPIAGKHSTGKIVHLDESHISVKRSERPLIAKSTILSFWDTLALQPCSQPKDITAFCLHFSDSGLADACAHFLGRIADAYSACGFGMHKSGELPDFTTNGVISLARESRSKLEALADALAKTVAIAGTAIVYVVVRDAHPNSYMNGCRQFLDLFRPYQKKRSTMGTSEKPLELALQVVPASFLISNDTLVVPVQRKYNNLAFEIFSRIPPETPATPGNCDYPLTLADTSGNVKFSLESQAIPPASMKDSVLHLAYSISEDLRWLIATWTDLFGHKALVMTYQLKTRRDARGRKREEIMKEMWEVSHDLMQKQRNKWRLVVARIGFCEAVEFNAWMHLANSEAKAQRCEVILVSTEAQPTLRFLAPPVQTRSGQPSSAGQQNTYGTPASTPQAFSTTSPENIVPATPTPGGTSALNAPTPPEHNFDTSVDGDLNLIDPSEESWAIVLPFGINQSRSIFDIRPALASGYLVKRLGGRDEDGATTVGVHLIHAPAPTSPPAPGYREELLQEILEQYRGLATLGMARGCIDRVRQVVPWHVHTSVTGSSALATVL